jgi:hypothetical protein
MPGVSISEYPPLPLTPRRLLRCEISALASLYWPLADIDNAVDVAWIESGFQTAAWNRDNEDSRGLWQINVSGLAHPELARFNLWDPQVNAYYAARIWRDSGWKAWYNSAKQLGLL